MKSEEGKKANVTNGEKKASPTVGISKENGKPKTNGNDAVEKKKKTIKIKSEKKKNRVIKDKKRYFKSKPTGKKNKK